MIESSYVLGLDVGGTNLKALTVRFDAAGDHADLREWQTPTGDDGTVTWQGNAAKLVLQITQELHGAPAAVGIAAPGLPEAGKPVIASMPGRLQGMEGLDWRKFFTPGTPVSVVNDARAALWGEIWRGAAQNCRNVVMLTLGTGVGGAVMVDGIVLQGHRNRAGHLGHISLNPYGQPDCVNTPGSLEDALGDLSLPYRSGGRFQATRDMLGPLMAGDPEAWAIWQRSVDHLAAAIVSLINVFDPEIVIIGGGIAKAGEMLFSPLEKAVRQAEWQFSGALVPIVPAQLSSHAGAVGATRVALNLLSI